MDLAKKVRNLFLGMALAACGEIYVQPDGGQRSVCNANQVVVDGECVDNNVSFSCSHDRDCPSDQSCIEQRCSGADTAQFRVYGVVKNWLTEAPVDGVVVRLGSLSDTTDATGSYSLPTVSEGTYRIEFEKLGFKDRKEDISVFGADKSFAVEMLPEDEYAFIRSNNIGIVSSFGWVHYRGRDRPLEIFFKAFTAEYLVCAEDRLPFSVNCRNEADTDNAPCYLIDFEANFTGSNLNLQTVGDLIGDNQWNIAECSEGTGSFTSSKYVTDPDSEERDYAVAVEGRLNFTGQNCECYEPVGDDFTSLPYDLPYDYTSLPYDYSLSFEFEFYQRERGDPFN